MGSWRAQAGPRSGWLWRPWATSPAPDGRGQALGRGCADGQGPGYKGATIPATPSGPVMTALRLLGLLAGLLATSRAGECLPQARCPHLCRGPAAGGRPWWEGPAGASPCFPGLKAQGGKAT